MSDQVQEQGANAHVETFKLVAAVALVLAGIAAFYLLRAQPDWLRWLAVAAGLALGILIAPNVGSIVPALERLFGFRFLDAQVYYITTIPSELHWVDVAWIGAAAFTLTLASTIYPALRAARTPPADALRYA